MSDLVDILETSRTFNLKHQITGLLLYYPQSFMQVLEGPKEAVRNLYYDRIFVNNRHTALNVHIEEPATQRLFPEWSMGFHHPSKDQMSETDGFDDFFEKEFKNDQGNVNKPLVIRLLLAFKKSASPDNIVFP